MGPYFHYRDFPVNPCTSLSGIAVKRKICQDPQDPQDRQDRQNRQKERFSRGKFLKSLKILKSLKRNDPQDPQDHKYSHDFVPLLYWL